MLRRWDPFEEKQNERRRYSNESGIDAQIVCVATLHVGWTGAVSRTTIVRCFEGPDGRVARKRHLRASSRGHVPRHKWWVGGAERIYEVSQKEDMITIFHVDGNRSLLTHYGSAG